jgi:hypothetical protein
VRDPRSWGVTIALAAVTTITATLSGCGGYEGQLLAGIPTTCISAEIPSRVGCEVARGKRADIGRVKKQACAGRGAAGITVGCRSIVSLPDIAQELGITMKPSHILYMRVEHRVVTSKPVVPLIR